MDEYSEFLEWLYSGRRWGCDRCGESIRFVHWKLFRWRLCRECYERETQELGVGA